MPGAILGVSQKRWCLTCVNGKKNGISGRRNVTCMFRAVLKKAVRFDNMDP